MEIGERQRCKSCGASDFKEKKGVAVCQFCGTKYAIKEPEPQEYPQIYSSSVVYGPTASAMAYSPTRRHEVYNHLHIGASPMYPYSTEYPE